MSRVDDLAPKTSGKRARSFGGTVRRAGQGSKGQAESGVGVPPMRIKPTTSGFYLGPRKDRTHDLRLG